MNENIWNDLRLELLNNFELSLYERIIESIEKLYIKPLNIKSPILKDFIPMDWSKIIN